MPLPKSFTTVTPLSKIIAMALFILLPFIGFYLGMRYERMGNIIPPKDTGCTYDAKICPDGSSVGRTGPNCEFTPCPTPSSIDDGVVCTLEAKECPDGSFVSRAGPICEFAPCPTQGTEKIFCGGIAAIECPNGGRCVLDGNYPDAGGHCVETSLPSKDMGTLSATVLFTGTPCRPGTGGVPPCDGPYPNYPVVIADRAGIVEVVSGKTDKNGVFTASLRPGTYKWTQNETGIGTQRNSAIFDINAGQTTMQTFQIDTGIR